METKFELIPGGIIERVDITRTQVNVPEQILRGIQANVTVTLKNVALIRDWGFLHLCVQGNGFLHATLPVQRILLRSSFDVVPDTLAKEESNIFVPNFASTENVMEMVWCVPDEMRLLLLLQIQFKPAVYSVTKSYLYCADKRPEYWRLPLANVYEDGSVCEGRQVMPFNSLLEAVTDMLTTFDNSRWTSHLWNEKEKSRSMFRFKALDKGFQTLPIAANSWITLCTKVVVGEVQRNIVL